MKKYLVTDDESCPSKEYNKWLLKEVNSGEGMEMLELPPNGKWLTRAEVEAFVSSIVHQYDYNAVYGGCELELDELFGETP